MISDATSRFSNRVEDYVKYRPGYPAGVVEALRRQGALPDGAVVADVGSGTGIFSEMLLATGCTVYGVEPNVAMRQAAERLLGKEPRFQSLEGTAEATNLPTGSVDLVAAAQAFHWFNPAAARTEFRRVLRPGGWVALVWNHRRYDATAFLRDYEALLQDFGTDYREVRRQELDPARVRDFVGSDEVTRTTLDNSQRLDFGGLRGRLLSSSYAPAPGHPKHEPMLVRLEQIFSRHQQDGAVSLDYDTEVFCARLADV